MDSTAKSQPAFKASFNRFAQSASEMVGCPWATFAALILILAWTASGPFFGYSDTWQLVINTGTTIITFLMVFLIQHTQNRDSKVIQMKLDELIRALGPARTELVQMETLSDDDLETMKAQFLRERDRAVQELEYSKSKTSGAS
jgi:low affinity Fe/Cu permease